MIVLLIGAPGAGKGTQADRLAESAGFRKISTGDALRNQVKLKTPVGNQAAEIMARGDLVPDNVLFEIVKSELGDDASELILLDGYPRTVNQARDLEKLEVRHRVAAVIYLEVNDDAIIERLSGRRVCRSCGATFHATTTPPRSAGTCDRCGSELVQRQDDQPQSIQTRLNVYAQATKPVIDFYKQKQLVRTVNGVGSSDEVFSSIQAILQAEHLV